MTDASIVTESSPVPRKSRPEWLKYLIWGIIGNAIVWSGVGIYLILPPTYTSKWGLMILGANPGVQISLPDVGQAVSDSQNNSRPKVYEDARSNYVYIAESPPLLKKVADIVGLSVEDYGEPDITTEDDSAIIAFEIEGTSPEEAQKKSIVFYQVLTQEINKIRETELQRRRKETENTLESARLKLTNAKAKLASYQNKSDFTSDEQIKDLSTNVEDLRKRRTELLSETQGINARLQQLSSDVKLFDQEAASAYKLQADNVYQQQFEKYSEISSEYISLSSELGLQHPQVLEKQAQLESAITALLERASFILDKRVNQKDLVNFSALTLDPKLKVSREDLYKDIITNQAERQANISQVRELDSQIARLETKLKRLVQEQSIIDRLKVDVQVSEAIFTATIAKLDLSKGNIDYIYPPFQLVAYPSLPEKDEPTFPDLTIGLVGGGAGSFLVITGLILLWWEKKINWKERQDKLVSGE